MLGLEDGLFVGNKLGLALGEADGEVLGNTLGL